MIKKKRLPMPFSVRLCSDKAAFEVRIKRKISFNMADLYEEEYREPTPTRATLGELFELTKKKVEFPQNIADAITLTNNARISAVHRSRFPVSDREAINALYRATNFSMWYFSRFQGRQ